MQLESWGDVVAEGRRKAGLSPLDEDLRDRMNRQFSGPGKHAIVHTNAQQKMRGMGDLLSWILALVGISGWVGCKCEKRRAWLNRWFPFWRATR